MQFEEYERIPIGEVFDESKDPCIRMPCKRGAMVWIRGLVSRPELNGKVALVTGAPTTSGRWPCCVAPMLDTEDLERIAAKPENVHLAPHPAHVMATAWNNLALAFKRADSLIEAEEAYKTSFAFAPPRSAVRAETLHNWMKCCMTMLRERVGDSAAVNEKLGRLLPLLFEPINTLPELSGLDNNMGYDFMPGYTDRRFFMAVGESAAAIQQKQYTRLWVFDSPSSAIVEIDPSTGRRLPTDAG